MSIDLNKEKSTMAFLEQATSELAKGLTFTNETAFNTWVTDNFTAIVERASELNAAILVKVIECPVSQAKIVKTMARNIHCALNNK